MWSLEESNFNIQYIKIFALFQKDQYFFKLETDYGRNQMSKEEGVGEIKQLILEFN
jgi:hypothetical protein